MESMSDFSLLIMSNTTEFGRGVLWLFDNLTFDVDARVNLFEIWLICIANSLALFLKFESYIIECSTGVENDNENQGQEQLTEKATTSSPMSKLANWTNGGKISERAHQSTFDDLLYASNS